MRKWCFRRRKTDSIGRIPQGLRRPVGLSALVCLGVLAVFAAGPMVQAADEIRGNAKVTSGNELVVGKRTVRLFGIEAPALEANCENKQAEFRCGVVAWAELIKLSDGQFVSCDLEPAASSPAI